MLGRLVAGFVGKQIYKASYNAAQAASVKKYLADVRKQHGDDIANTGRSVWEQTHSPEALVKAVNAAIAKKQEPPRA